MVRDENGKFMPGSGGRPPGTKNRFSQVKADLFAAYETVREADEKAGVEFWRYVKKTRPGLFARLLVSLLPKEISIGIQQTAEELHAELLETISGMDRVTMPLPPREPDLGGNGDNGDGKG